MFVKETLLFPSQGRSNYRIPSLVATKHGTVLAFCNDRKDSVADEAEEVSLVLCRKRAGEDWSEEKTLKGLAGWNCVICSAVYDEETDVAMCSFGRSPITRSEWEKYTKEQLDEMERAAERKAKEQGVERGNFLVYSDDDGESWCERPHVVKPYIHVCEDGSEKTIVPSCHGSAHGITLRHGTHKGRLLCPSRYTVGAYHSFAELSKVCYNNAIYSDDHGKTWQTSAPVQIGTGEGVLIEREDGSILYNSRAYLRDGKRYLAVSQDGGASYGEFAADPFLMEETGIGCNASMIRVERDELPTLPQGVDSITVFVNPRAETRKNLTACISFDSGKTWTQTKEIWKSGCAYTSLAYSSVDRHFYLMYEKGDDTSPYKQGIAMLEFDLEWLLADGSKE